MIIISIADKTKYKDVSLILKKSFAKQVKAYNLTKENSHFAGLETVKDIGERAATGDVIILLEVDSKNVGTVSYEMVAKNQKGIIKRLAVLPEFQKNGYGKLLIEYVESILKAGSTIVAELSIAAQFSKLQAYYEGLGYIPLRKEVFNLFPYEVLTMQKKLGG